VPKNDARVEAYGTVDEANAAMGLARAAGLPPEQDAWVKTLQDDLFLLGAELACDPSKLDKLRTPLIGAERIAELERWID